MSPHSDKSHQLTDLKDLTFNQLSDFIKNLGEPAFRAKQIFSWLYRPNIHTFEQMTNLSKDFRAKLSTISLISQLSLLNRETSKDGTVKYAFELEDKHLIESVLIPDDGRYTLCVSSQAGCAMGCSFCLTGTMGFQRNLKPSEIVNQVCFAMDELASNNLGRVNNLVFMGMGEPLANYNNLIYSLDILTDSHGIDFSDRKITVSTCGVVPKIDSLGRDSKVNLAISLHASNETTRNNLMPVNNTYSLDEVLNACRRYPLPKRKRIMIEYILLKDINDSKKDAKNLVKILHGIPCKINLLPFNEGDALPFKSPNHQTTLDFQEILHDAGCTAIIRESRGADISAACGQLASKKSA